MEKKSVMDSATAPLRHKSIQRLLASALVLCVIYWAFSEPKEGIWAQHGSFAHSSTKETFVALNGSFQSMPVSGHINRAVPDNSDCATLEHRSVLEVQQNLYLEDDLFAIADGLKDHPMINYTTQDPNLSYQDVVIRTWRRTAHAGVWLEHLQVYLLVTRVFWFDRYVNAPIISFLRGQIFNAGWEELRGYTLHWEGKKLTFPKIFDVDTPYEQGADVFGPEDPRIIIEEGTREPVVVFNMIIDVKGRQRGMYVYRPFSNILKLLTIAGEERKDKEKNWAPFFYRSSLGHERGGQESSEIHFVYGFDPLTILRCSLLDGMCNIVYKAKASEDFVTTHPDMGAPLRGGTNLEPIPQGPGQASQSFLGIPRTHVFPGCDGGFYRPHIVVLTASSPDTFHLAYLSDAIDFQGAAFDRDPMNPCGPGRILIPSSVPRWMNTGTGYDDDMDVTFSLNDETTQVLRLRGVRALVESIPQTAFVYQDEESSASPGSLTLWCSSNASVADVSDRISHAKALIAAVS